MVELLIVILIIGVLIALLLPAVQYTRESARRTQCSNNLMQLSFALKNYESTHAVLPPGVVNPTRPVLNVPTGYHYSWIVQILPYIEQTPVFNALNFSVNIYHPSNTTVRHITLKNLLCPSDVVAKVSPDGAIGTNYAGCHNDVEEVIDTTNRGVFYLNSKLAFDDISDGVSNTIFLGERQHDATEWGWASGTPGTLRNAGRAPTGYSRRPAMPTIPGTTVTPANWVGGFGSVHEAGVNFAMGDGTLRLIKRSINMNVYRRLANRADGEIVSAESY
jgi:hypothetical protein